MTYFIFNINEFQIISKALINCDGLFHFPMSYSTMICSYIQAEWFCSFALIHTLSIYKDKLLKGSSTIRKHKRKHESRQTWSKKCVQVCNKHTETNVWANVLKLHLTFQTIPREMAHSQLTTSWQMTFDFMATSNHMIKTVTQRSLTPLWSHTQRSERMWIQKRDGDTSAD